MQLCRKNFLDLPNAVFLVFYNFICLWTSNILIFLSNKGSPFIQTFCSPQEFQYCDFTAFIVFLNKDDIFKEKIKHSHLADHFPDFKGLTRARQNQLKWNLQSWARTQNNAITVPARPKWLYKASTCAPKTLGSSAFVQLWMEGMTYCWAALVLMFACYIIDEFEIWVQAILYALPRNRLPL